MAPTSFTVNIYRETHVTMSDTNENVIVSDVNNTDGRHLKAFKGEFQNLGTVDILDQITLCWDGGVDIGSSLHCRIFSSILGLYSLDVVLTFQL